jgi:hypothetical protein
MYSSCYKVLLESIKHFQHRCISNFTMALLLVQLHRARAAYGAIAGKLDRCSHHVSATCCVPKHWVEAYGADKTFMYTAAGRHTQKHKTMSFQALEKQQNVKDVKPIH